MTYRLTPRYSTTVLFLAIFLSLLLSPSSALPQTCDTYSILSFDLYRGSDETTLVDDLDGAFRGLYALNPAVSGAAISNSSSEVIYLTDVNSNGIADNGDRWDIVLRVSIKRYSGTGTDLLDGYLENRHSTVQPFPGGFGLGWFLVTSSSNWPVIQPNGTVDIGITLRLQGAIDLAYFTDQYVQFLFELLTENCGPATPKASALSVVVQFKYQLPPVAEPTNTPTPAPTNTPTPTFTNTPTPTVTDTPTPGATPTFTPTYTFTPTPTATVTPTPVPASERILGILRHQGNQLVLEPLVRIDQIQSATGVYWNHLYKVPGQEVFMLRSRKGRVVYTVP